MNIAELTVRRFLFIIQKYSSNKVENALATELLKKLFSQNALSLRAWLHFPRKTSYHNWFYSVLVIMAESKILGLWTLTLVLPKPWTSVLHNLHQSKLMYCTIYITNKTEIVFASHCCEFWLMTDYK